MPFLREALNDMAFIPQHTELETYSYLPPPPKASLLTQFLLQYISSLPLFLQPKPFMKATLPSVTFVGLAECIIKIYEEVFSLLLRLFEKMIYLI